MDESPLETVLASTCNGTPGIDNSISDYNWYFRDAKLLGILYYFLKHVIFLKCRLRKMTVMLACNNNYN